MHIPCFIFFQNPHFHYVFPYRKQGQIICKCKDNNSFEISNRYFNIFLHLCILFAPIPQNHPQSDPIYIWNSNFPCATSLGIQATSHPVVKIV